MDEDPNFRKGWEWPDGWMFSNKVRTRREKFGAMVGPAIFLAFLIQPISATVNGTNSVVYKVAVLLTILGYAVAYVVAAVWGQSAGHRERTILFVIMAAFVVLMAVLLGPDALLFSTYLVSSALMSLPRNVGALIGLASTAALIIGTRIADGAADWSGAWVLVVLTGAMFAFGALVTTIKELRTTQERMATLAVAEERSRLARDLHDVLGHSLTTITVKAGLARRVLESSADVERAIDEVRDVEDLARQAMSEVRATVSGYRTASLPAELVGARAALKAAGITADLPHAVDNVAAGLQETFAYVLREGVTNVIRHSEGATGCQVRLGADWLEVRDDGRSSSGGVGRSRAAGGGHGLSGLAERVAAVDAELEAKPLPEGGFMLRVSVPGDQNDRKEDQPVASQSTDKPVATRPSVGLA